MSDGRVFLLESPNALDLLEGTGETTSLSQVCKLFGHDFASFLIRDQQELGQTLMYISSLGWRKRRGKQPIFIHLSGHGSDEGLAIGSDDVSWKQLATLVVETFREIYSHRKPYAGPIVLVVSACKTDGQTLRDHFSAAYRKKTLNRPPQYIFVFEDTRIDWRDAVVTWTMFYREAPEINFKNAQEKDAVQELLERVNRAGYGKLRYFRWDRKARQYKTHVAKDRSS